SRRRRDAGEPLPAIRRQRRRSLLALGKGERHPGGAAPGGGNRARRPRGRSGGRGVTGLPPNSELILAAFYFLADPRAGRERLAKALELEVDGSLHDRLQRAARNALAARPCDWPLVRDGLRELMRVIRLEAERHKEAERRREPSLNFN